MLADCVKKAGLAPDCRSRIFTSFLIITATNRNSPLHWVNFHKEKEKSPPEDGDYRHKALYHLGGNISQLPGNFLPVSEISVVDKKSAKVV